MNENFLEPEALPVESVDTGDHAEMSPLEQERLRALYAVDQPLLSEEQGRSLTEMTKHGENHTLLMMSRLKDPVIRDQWLDLLEENQVWLQNTPERRIRFKNELDDDGMPVWEPYFAPREFTPKSRELLSQEIDEAIDRELALTQIDLSVPHMNSFSRMDPQDRHNPLKRSATIGVKASPSTTFSGDPTTHKSVAEAHEKGHVIRAPEHSGYLHQRFAPAFDLSNFNPDTYTKFREEGMSDADILQFAQEYLFNFSEPVEIIERMSQLKNYFGLKGHELFTKEHLDYARNHYLKDGMLDNNMQTFFDAITPETEEAFLKLINSSGI
jgi:hypothetical protein